MLTACINLYKYCLYGIEPSDRSGQYINLLTKSAASDLINSFTIWCLNSEARESYKALRQILRQEKKIFQCIGNLLDSLKLMSRFPQ